MNIRLDVHIPTTMDSSYQIVIGKNLAACAGEILRTDRHSHYFIVTDTNVEPLYGKAFRLKLKAGKGIVHSIVLPSGERSKSRAMKNYIEDKLLSLGAHRDSTIIALGGGVIGDLAGFVAATFLRGIPCIQIPTTLLSQVDSSIGGKTGINHPAGKNLIGVFSQPKQVFIDPETLLTLSDAEFMNGMAEVIKYGAILDRLFFEFLERSLQKIRRRELPTITKIVARCCELKYRVVEKDERELSSRRVLNFGHTIGHALEAVSKYRISHGRAVAIGMCTEAKFAVSLGLLPRREYERLRALVDACDLPSAIPPGTDLNHLLQSTLHDKKVQNGIVRYTLLEKIGKARIGVPISTKEAVELSRS